MLVLEKVQGISSAPRRRKKRNNWRIVRWRLIDVEVEERKKVKRE